MLQAIVGGFIGGVIGYWVSYAFSRWRGGRRYQRFLRGELTLPR